ncbi:unnamed protein product [Calypogeia fissa]
MTREQTGLVQRVPKQDAEDIYTSDGSVNLKGEPSIRAKSGGWKACPFILGNECCERLAYYGIGTNLVVYLTNVLHQSNSTAATNVTNWAGTCYITPLIGGFVADAFLGRYWTIAVFSTVYCIGMLLLALSASLHQLRPPPCDSNGFCPKPEGAQIGVFYLALYLVALGTGGIKPCVSSFGADQFDENDVDEAKKKTSFFNWFYFSINIGALISASVLVYVQNNVSWGWGFGIPAIAMGLAICFFFFGTPRYRHQKPKGSPLTKIFQVFVAALKKFRVPSHNSDMYEIDEGELGRRKLQHTAEFRCLDKAAIRTDSDVPPSSPWRLVTVTQVEEVKLLIRLLPIWVTSIVFATVYAQMSTLFVEQGGVMDRRVGPHFTVGAATMTIFDTIAVLIWVPIYDRILVPFVRRTTGDVRGFTQLQRMGIGLVISIFAMVAAAVVEIERLKVARQKGLVDDGNAVPLSVFWQIPQYFFIGAAEVFFFIGQIEFFYDQSPDSMRSFGSALSLTTVALGNYLSSLLVTIIGDITQHNGKVGWIPDNLNKGHLDYFFWLLAVLSVLNFLAYLVFARWFTYKKIDRSKIVDIEQS